MMVIQLLSANESQIHEIADYLLGEGLIGNAMLTGPIVVKTCLEGGAIKQSIQFKLQGISKSLLFSEINKRLKDKYGERMPLLYSEPIILIDPQQTDDIIERLVRV